MAMATGVMPTEMVAETVSVAVSMTEMVLTTLFATYALVPLGLKAMATGASPTLKVLVTVLVAVPMTEMVLVPPTPFATYALPPTGLKATVVGLMPTPMVPMIVCACRGADRQPPITARHPMILKRALVVADKYCSLRTTTWPAAANDFATAGKSFMMSPVNMKAAPKKLDMH